MRLVKCRNCSTKTPQDVAYKIVHVTSGGKEQNRYYCTEECYRKEQSEIFMLKQCQYFIDEVMGYMVINNEKNKQISEIVAAGYTREELYDCMVELKQKILEGLNYRQDIEEEINRIRYVFAIIKANIKVITDKKKMESFNKNKIEQRYDDIEVINTNYTNKKRKSVLDRLGEI